MISIREDGGGAYREAVVKNEENERKNGRKMKDALGRACVDPRAILSRDLDEYEYIICNKKTMWSKQI